MTKRLVVDEVTRSPSKGTCCTAEEGKTRQSEAALCDINLIVARLSRGEVATFREDGVYADVSDIGDFRESLEKVRRANEAFAALSPRIRNAFENDPGKFVDAFQSPDGTAKLRELGVIPELEETVAERKEAAAEARAEKRREARELAKRVEKAKQSAE